MRCHMKALSMSLDCKYSTNKHTVLHNHICSVKSSPKLTHDPQKPVLLLCSREEKEVEAVCVQYNLPAINQCTIRLDRMT